MRVPVAGVGWGAVLDVPGPRGIDAALEDLTTANAELISAGRAPRFGERPLRYRADRPTDCWQTADLTAVRGGGDCEDLATYYAADLRLDGIPARATWLRVGPRSGHALVFVDGVYIDPSAALGMPWFPARYSLGRRRGVWTAEARVPSLAGCVLRGVGRASDPFEACEIALGGVGAEVGRLVGAAFGAPEVGAVVGSFAETAARAIWGGGHVPEHDFWRWALSHVSESEASASDGPTALRRSLEEGLIPVYCGQSEATREWLTTEAERIGWSEARAKRWSKTYRYEVVKRDTFFGFVLRRDKAPQSVRDAARRVWEGLAPERYGELIQHAKELLKASGSATGEYDDAKRTADLIRFFALVYGPEPSGPAAPAPGPAAPASGPTAPASGPAAGPLARRRVLPVVSEPQERELSALASAMGSARAGDLVAAAEIIGRLERAAVLRRLLRGVLR